MYVTYVRCTVNQNIYIKSQNGIKNQYKKLFTANVFFSHYFIDSL